jgi:methylaspartate ammonia-lyase
LRIRNVLFVPGYSGSYFDDQKAIKGGADADGFIYRGHPLSPGFSAIRQAGECISVLLILDDNSVAVGDCVAVQYSGAAGRDPLFLAEHYSCAVEQIVPLLIGRSVEPFLENARFFDALEIEGNRMHSAIQYGVTQALLEAAAIAGSCTKAEVICREFDLPLVPEPIPLFAQSGDDRYAGVDKMILKKVDVLPHALINSVEKLGRQGEKLAEYIDWVVRRIGEVRLTPDYRPAIHIDVYGTTGDIFERNPLKIADYIARLGNIADNYQLYIEGPVDMGNKQDQIAALVEIREHLDGMGSPVRIVADEWCNTFEDIVEFADARACHMLQIKTPDLGSIHNTVESVLYCNRHESESYLGGSANETDIAARVCVHLALAARPERLLVKPGLGFDEGMSIMCNEMRRTVALLGNTHSTRC